MQSAQPQVHQHIGNILLELLMVILTNSKSGVSFNLVHITLSLIV
jgi:hypothetical protein